MVNIYALATGFILAIAISTKLIVPHHGRMTCHYPILLATFPAYYWLFAISALDYNALFLEVLVGIFWIALSYIAYQKTKFIGLILLTVGYIGHAVYDVAHDLLFINAGTPRWWPEFCGVIDMMLGLYLLYVASVTNHGSSNG